jgi:hypothetical protein
MPTTTRRSENAHAPDRSAPETQLVDAGARAWARGPDADQREGCPRSAHALYVAGADALTLHAALAVGAFAGSAGIPVGARTDQAGWLGHDGFTPAIIDTPAPPAPSHASRASVGARVPR